MSYKYLTAIVAAALLGSQVPAFGQATFGASTPTSLPVAWGLPIFTSGLVSVMGSVDYTGPATALTGSVVINGDLRLNSASPLTVKASGRLYVYGNLFAPAGGLRIEQGGHVYFYGSQLVAAASTSQDGQGALHLISPRPAGGASADGQQRPSALDGLASGSSLQQVDGNGSSWNVSLEHRAAAGLSLVDLDANGLADLVLSGTLTLSTDNAPLTLGRNKLIFDQRQAGAQATVTGYSPQRYVATDAGGLVQVLGLADGAVFTFPIGASASGDYTPAQFTNHTGSPATLGVGVAASAAMPAAKSSGRYWTLSAPAAATGDLVLQHNLASNEAGYNNSQAVIAANSSGAWQPVGPPAAGSATGPLSTTGPVSGASALTQLQANVPAGVTQFTKETLTPLPVTLVDFTAGRASGGLVVLRWATASELDNAGFQVEASTDAQTWLPRGSFVPGNGTTVQAHRYTWQESNPAATYYRLTQRDLNGQSTYSPVQYVSALNGPVGLTLYPNPGVLGGFIHLDGASPTEPTDLLNAMGQIAAHCPAGSTELSLTGLPAGVYVVRHAGQSKRLIVR